MFRGVKNKFGIIKCVECMSCDEKVKIRSHFSFIRRHLEYAARICDPGMMK
jgi:hypothetical protein